MHNLKSKYITSDFYIVFPLINFILYYRFA